ncbi:MAG: alanine racemase [Gammaproteobacteria bacterium]|nr:alanine racemase [Gammaproteobacteria bacterium]
MTRPLRARIDLAALRHNLQRARQAAPASRIMAVVKANAYGHGMPRIAQALAADGFAVASLEEALGLREAGIRQSITLLEGFFDSDELVALSRYRLQPVVHCDEQLWQLEAASLSQPISVWMKIDTGMHRLGFAPERAAEIHQRLHVCPNVEHIGLFSHLGYTDDRRSAQTQRQCELFLSASHGLPGERSLANSGGLLAWPETQLEWVRPGLMLYGISPFAGDTGPEQGLCPVMTLESRLIAVNQYPRGAAIGYSGAWVCPEDMLIGVAAVGYGDGYPRHALTGTPVLVNGRRAQIVGCVSMDMISIDLRGQPDVHVGAPVTLWGRGLPVEEIARCAGTIAYELVCAVASRVPVVIEEGVAAEPLTG